MKSYKYCLLPLIIKLYRHQPHSPSVSSLVGAQCCTYHLYMIPFPFPHFVCDLWSYNLFSSFVRICLYYVVCNICGMGSRECVLQEIRRARTRGWATMFLLFMQNLRLCTKYLQVLHITVKAEILCNIIGSNIFQSFQFLPVCSDCKCLQYIIPNLIFSIPTFIYGTCSR